MRRYLFLFYILLGSLLTIGLFGQLICLQWLGFDTIEVAFCLLLLLAQCKILRGVGAPTKRARPQLPRWPPMLLQLEAADAKVSFL